MLEGRNVEKMMVSLFILRMWQCFFAVLMKHSSVISSLSLLFIRTQRVESGATVDATSLALRGSVATIWQCGISLDTAPSSISTIGTSQQPPPFMSYIPFCLRKTPMMQFVLYFTLHASRLRSFKHLRLAMAMWSASF